MQKKQNEWDFFSTYPIKTVYVNHFFVTEVAGLLKSLVNHCSFSSFACNIRTLWAQSSHFTDLMYYWTSESHLSYYFSVGWWPEAKGKTWVTDLWKEVRENSANSAPPLTTVLLWTDSPTRHWEKSLLCPALLQEAAAICQRVYVLCALCFSTQEVKSYAMCMY